LVIVLVVFMLIQRENLRDRLIRLWGSGSLTRTTRALDDASRRISRFLLMQLLVNGTFGILFGSGLFFIGVPYAFLWGSSAPCCVTSPTWDRGWRGCCRSSSASRCSPAGRSRCWSWS